MPDGTLLCYLVGARLPPAVCDFHLLDHSGDIDQNMFRD